MFNNKQIKLYLQQKHYLSISYDLKYGNKNIIFIMGEIIAF